MMEVQHDLKEEFKKKIEDHDEDAKLYNKILENLLFQKHYGIPVVLVILAAIINFGVMVLTIVEHKLIITEERSRKTDNCDVEEELLISRSAFSLDSS